MKRVAHIIAQVGQGGAEKVLADIVNAGAGVSHHVISLMGGEPHAPMPAADFHDLGLERGEISLGVVSSLRRIVKKLNPDIVQGWLYHGNAASIFTRLYAPLTLWSIHNTELSREGSKRSTRLLDRAGILASHVVPETIVYASQPARIVHEAKGYARKKGLVIENGIDLSVYAFNEEARITQRKALGVSGDILLIGSLARFDPQKDHRTLIAAFRLLRNGNPDAKLLLVGDGCDRENPLLMQWLHEAEVMSSTLLLGRRSDVPALLCALDLVAISSAYGEAMPLVAMEAAAIGLPVVATDVGEVSPFVLGPGDIVPPRNPEALGAALLSALSRKDFSLQSEPWRLRRTRLEERYSLSAMTHLYEKLYLNP